MPLSKERKSEYFDRMKGMLSKYNACFIVSVDNVGSQQMHETRISLRGEAEILMGKNTMMRKILKDFIEENPGHPVGVLSDALRGNVGLVFTNGDLGSVRDQIMANRVPAPARVGAIAPVDVVVPPGPTGADPGQTSFFQALQIATKIQKGQIEIVSPVHLIHAGDKVGSSEAVLLQKLNIKPFTYGLEIQGIYNAGSVFAPDVLDITDDIITSHFLAGVARVAALSLQLGRPTLASLPHSIANAFKTIIAVTVQCENYTFEKAEPFKAFVKDPSAFLAAMGGGAGGGGGGGGETAQEAKAEEKAEEEEEEEMDLGGGMDMFGGDEGY